MAIIGMHDAVLTDSFTETNISGEKSNRIKVFFQGNRTTRILGLKTEPI